MKHLIGVLLISLVLNAESYPQLFSSLGTPLYEADKVFANTSFSKPVQAKIDIYHEEAKKTLQLGRDIENAELPEMETIQFYHTALRRLNTEHNDILDALKNGLRTAIRQDDYTNFKRIVDLHLDALFEQESLKLQVVSYYKQHKPVEKDPYIDNMASDLKQMQAQKVQTGETYEEAVKRQPLILLTASWCNACKRAKAYLREHRIVFQEYDIERSSYGKKLYKERKGYAIPMMIIGDQFRTGFDPKWIKKHR